MAFRLIFESSDGQFTLLRKMRVDMVAPDAPTDLDQLGPGTYAEVRNDRDETIYRANISAQIDPTHEIFGVDASVKRVPVADHKRVAAVVVPDPPDAHAVVVVHRATEQPLDGERRLAKAALNNEHELLRVSLTDEQPTSNES